MSNLAGWLLLFVLLLVLSFNTTWGTPFVFVALIPLFIFIEKARQHHWKNRRIVKYIWVSAFAFSLLLLFWWNQLQLDASADSFHQQVRAATFLIWIIVSLEATIGILFTIVLVTKLKINLFKPSTILYLPAIWTISEVLRSYFASVIWWHPDATMGALWNIGSLGYAAASTPFGHLATISGLYGFGFIVVAINIAIYWIISKKNLRIVSVVLVLVLIINFASILIYSKPNGEKIDVGIMQVERFGVLNKNEFAEAINKNPPSKNLDVVILSEYSYFFGNYSNNTQKDIMDKLFKKEPGVIISAGGPDKYIKHDKSKQTSTIVYKNEKLQPISVQEKNFLIAFGEYLPKTAEIFVKTIGQGKTVKKFSDTREILKEGEKPESPVRYNNIVYGTLSCSGVVASSLFNNLANKGAEVLVSNSSLGIVDRSTIALTQAEQMIRFTALATSRPYLQASRGGYSYIIDNNGNILLKDSATSAEFLAGSVSKNSKKTPYTKLGEIFIPISIVILAILLYNRRKLLRV